MTATVARCVAAASIAFDIPLADILSPKRIRPVVRARQAAMALASAKTNSSLPAIGSHMGRDHTSVLHGVRRAAELRLSDPDFEEMYRHAESFMPDLLGRDGEFYRHGYFDTPTLEGAAQ